MQPSRVGLSQRCATIVGGAASDPQNGTAGFFGVQDRGTDLTGRIRGDGSTGIRLGNGEVEIPQVLLEMTV